MSKTFGDFLKERREELGLSAGQLALRADITEGYVRKLESDNVKSPSAEVVFKLANALNMRDRLQEFEPYLYGEEIVRKQEKAKELEKEVNDTLLKSIKELNDFNIDSNIFSSERLDKYINTLEQLAKTS